MNNFFSKIKKKHEEQQQQRKQQQQQQEQQSKSNRPKNNVAEGLANIFQNKNAKHYKGEANRLGGGSQPGRVFRVTLPEAGPLGIKVEKRPNKESTIVSWVSPNSQADQAGLQRGDILCHVDTNGQEEILYKVFLKMAADDTQRPLTFDVRRIETSSTPNASSNNYASHVSADAFVKKQAMIAAAEARDRANRDKYRSTSKPTKSLKTTSVKGETNKTISSGQDQPITEEARIAIQQAKNDEQIHSAKLGYNPYETARMTSGQAKTATVNTTHGTINAADGNNINPPTVTTNYPVSGPGPTSAPTGNTLQSTTDDNSGSNHSQLIINEAFDDAFMTLVTSSNDDSSIRNALTIMRKLIVNATTKGQQIENDNAEKFRRVRLSNPKIKAAITDIDGAIDIMMICGFILSENEDDGETYLVFQPGTTGPTWLPQALKKMEQYCGNKS